MEIPMSAVESADGALFPDREAEWDKEAESGAKRKVIAEFRKYCREVIRPDVQGIISYAAASRYLEVSESLIRHYIGENMLRDFRYPTIKVKGVAVRDVLRLKVDRDKQKGGTDEAAV